MTRTGNALVVGHTNTIPDLIKALGITKPIAIGENEYDDLFVVQVSETARPDSVALSTVKKTFHYSI